MDMPTRKTPATGSITRRAFVGSALAAGGAAALGGLPGSALAARPHWAGGVYPPAPRQVNGPPAPWSLGPGDPEVAQFVVDEFLHAWNGYKQFAWGHDQVNPIAGTPNEFFVDGHPIGLSIIEALDTLYVMELDDEVSAGVKWIDQNVNFDIDGNFHVFEAIIRVVGGLIAGYLAVKDKKLLALARGHHRPVDARVRLPDRAALPVRQPAHRRGLRQHPAAGRDRYQHPRVRRPLPAHR